MKIFWMILMALSATAGAKVYYVTQGVKYHIGDDRFALSNDPDFVGAYPVVGKQWLQAFQVSEDDQVKVSIGKIWGVDDCPYCKIIVAIDDHDMGRLFSENNHHPFETLAPLAFSATKGSTHLLKITSYGDQRVDDFVVADISVETAKAEIRFLKPGPVMRNPEDALPAFQAPQASVDSCEGRQPRPALASAFSLDGRASDSESAELDRLKPGEAAEFQFELQGIGQGSDLVARNVEILLGSPSPSGWVLSFDRQGKGLPHGNLLIHGEYRSKSFSGGALLDGLNRLKISRCPDGSARLYVNGREVSTLPLGVGEEGLSLRARGLKAGFRP